MEIGLIDLSTGELFTMADVDLTEQQTRLLAEYQEWEEIKKICALHQHPLGVKEAARKRDFIERDFLWASKQRGKLVAIRNDQPPNRR